jgi:RNA polymerase sigma factor (sigma-70 family)
LSLSSEACMNVHFTYKLSKTPDVENLINHQVDKLRKRLQVFKPDMIALYGTIDEDAKIGYTASLNLRLPSGQMAARDSAESAQSVLRSVFDKLSEQLNKHKAQLRSQHQWPRTRRVERTRPVPQVPFEETLAAVHPDSVSQGDIDEFVNANLDRLRRYVERELTLRNANGQDGLRDVAVDEVVSEAVASALDENAERPDKVAIEAWLFQLARRAIDRIVRESASDVRDVALDSRAHKLNENSGDDDALSQFDFDADTVTSANSVPDGGATPEEIFANDEIIAMVQSALRGAKPEDREAFILFTLEGFTIRELSAITDRSEDAVRRSIRDARDTLKRGMPVSDPLKNRIVERSKIA